jgi:hypothetical protein
MYSAQLFILSSKYYNSVYLAPRTKYKVRRYEASYQKVENPASVSHRVSVYHTLKSGFDCWLRPLEGDVSDLSVCMLRQLIKQSPSVRRVLDCGVECLAVTVKYFSMSPAYLRTYLHAIPADYHDILPLVVQDGTPSRLVHSL